MQTLSQFANAAAAWVAANVMVSILWAGLLLLTIALLVLMRTNWGQARPLTKCVVLSVFAHVLLTGYAYVTTLILTVPTQPGEETITLTMNDGLAENNLPAAQPQPWEEPRPAPDFDVVESQQPDRKQPTPELKRPEPSREQLTTIRPPPIAADPIDQPPPERPQPETVEQQIQRTPAEVAAEPIIEESQPQPPTEETPIGPEIPEQLARRELPQENPLRPSASELTDQPRPEEDQIQELSDLPLDDVLANALAADRDTLREATNKTPGETNSPGASNAENPLPAARTRPSPAGEMRRLGDGEKLPDLYAARFADNQLKIAEQHGGSAKTQEAVQAALAWLAAHQSEDGRWDADKFGAGRETLVLGHDRAGAGTEADTGITGLCVLAFMAAGNTHLEGKYRKNVQKGLEFLLSSQTADGNLAGQSRLFARMYCHGMASLAISEAYALTGDERIKPFVERAVGYTIASQNRTSGGWRYQPNDQGDMSQFGWQVMALTSAEHAGIRIPAETRAGMLRFLTSTTSGPNRGLAAYRPGERPSPTMTAEALACRYFLRTEHTAATIQEAADYILQSPPANGTANLYGWYYATVALFQVQGEHWSRWNNALAPQLLARQRKTGNLAGSWDPDTTWGGYGGRAYSTAMACLCLEVYYRYLPVQR